MSTLNSKFSKISHLNMQLKVPSLLVPVRRLYGSQLRTIIARPMSMIIPDPPCKSRDPNCHHVRDPCRNARNVLKLKLPFDKNMAEMERQNKAYKFEPRCCVLRSAHRHPCVTTRRKVKKEDKPVFRSMWEPPGKLKRQSNCKDLFPRFDEMFYKPSNKFRCFQRTWVECSPIKQRLKKVCCLDGIDPPEIVRRIKEPCPVVTCTFDYARMRHICEKKDPDSKCCKTHWPCCKPARCPPTCPPTKRPSDCKRLRTPYRCFSDTKRWERPRRQRECFRSTPSKCETYAAQHRHEIYGIKSHYCL